MNKSKAQSILEYLIVLTAILAAVLVAGRGVYTDAIRGSYEGGNKLINDETKKVWDAVK